MEQPPEPPPPAPPGPAWGSSDGWDGWGSASPPGWSEPPATVPPRRRAAALGAIALLLVSILAFSAWVGGSLTRRAPAPGTLGSDFSGSGPLDTASLSARVSPAVVDIVSTFPEGVGAGSGMVVTSSGEVVTNNHVVDGAELIEVQIAGTGPSYNARVIGSDAGADVALLQIQGASGLATVSTGDSAKVAIGDPVVAVGNALGREGPPSAAQGQVTGLDRTITATDDTGQSAETLTGLIQVDANVVPGDSGGPLVDKSGKVIGMDTAASSRRFHIRTGASEGFAIPIATVLSVAQQIRTQGSTSTASPSGPTALLGVEARDAASANGPGAMVVNVVPGSPADGAGIVAGDIIVSVGGRDVQSAAALRAAIRAHKPGDRVQVGWIDPSGQQQSATVQLSSTG